MLSILFSILFLRLRRRREACTRIRSTGVAMLSRKVCAAGEPENQEADGQHRGHAGSRVVATAAAYGCTGLGCPRQYAEGCHHCQSAKERVLRAHVSGHCEREAEAQKIVGLIVEQVIDDTVTPPLWVAWIRNRQTRRPQNKVVQGA